MDELIEDAEVLAAALSFVDGAPPVLVADAAAVMAGVAESGVGAVLNASLLDSDAFASPVGDNGLLGIEFCASPLRSLDLAALEAPGTSLTESDEPPPIRSSTPLQPTSSRTRRSARAAGTPAKRSTNHARDEARKELKQLRVLVPELQGKVALLREAKGSSARVASQLTSDERVARIWKQSAKLQLEQRLKSVGENRRLRQLLKRQVKVATTLRQLIQSQVTRQAMEYCGLGSPHHAVRNMQGSSSEAEVFRYLLMAADAAYQRLDAVFQLCGRLDESGFARDGALLHIDESGALTSRLLTTKVFPFGYDAAQRAAWQHYGFATRPFASRFHLQRDPQLLPTVANGDNVVVERFMLQIGADETTALFRVHQVVRRFVEPGRTVIVIQSRSDPVQFAGRALDAPAFEETNCIVVQAAETLPAEAFAALRTCVDTACRSASSQGERGRELFEFVLRCKRATTVATHSVLENLLFDQRACGVTS